MNNPTLTDATDVVAGSEVGQKCGHGGNYYECEGDDTRGRPVPTRGRRRWRKRLPWGRPGHPIREITAELNYVVGQLPAGGNECFQLVAL
jgi:hypothetical protein